MLNNYGATVQRYNGATVHGARYGVQCNCYQGSKLIIVRYLFNNHIGIWIYQNLNNQISKIMQKESFNKIK